MNNYCLQYRMFKKYRLFILIFMCIRVIFCGNDLPEDVMRQKMIERLSRAETNIVENYELITRSAGISVYRYRGYRTVSILYYPMPEDVTLARFYFQAENIHMNLLGSCKDNDIEIYLKRGTIPTVNPDGYPFPADFIKETERASQLYNVAIISNSINKTLTIDNPQAGDWYAVAYIKWEDPRTQQVSQQGLTANCETVLYTDLQVKRSPIQVIDCYSHFVFDISNSTGTSMYKCKASTTPVHLNATVNNNINQTNLVLIRIGASHVPSSDQSLISCYTNLDESPDVFIDFQTHPKTWHYITIEYINGNITNMIECKDLDSAQIEDQNLKINIVPLVRDHKGFFFNYFYNMPSNDFHNPSNVVNLTSNEIQSLKYQIHPVIDIGGTMTLMASLVMNLKYFMGYVRESEGNTTELAFSDSDPFFKVVICSDIGHHSVPTSDGFCKHNFAKKRATFILNSTDTNSVFDKQLIPFPDSGTWYITMRIFCFDPATRRNANNSIYYIETDPQKQVPKLLPAENKYCNVSVMFDVSSSSCVGGTCSGHGRCIHSTTGGIVISSCNCDTGYGGWSCSDDSRMDSRKELLISLLLLTLSNIVFIFSVYVALIRKYYTEAIMYAFTMLFSTFYHACDTHGDLEFCIFSLGLLQFGDFYCGIMSFWVTLLAMSIINKNLFSALQLTGAIVVALLTRWNMQSLIAFMLPVSVGVGIVLLSWIRQYWTTRKLFFPKSYFTIYLPTGLVLVSIGLICYAFLQTENNYKIVHSLWHMIIAVSVVCLLPDVKRTDPSRRAFLPSASFLLLLLL